MRTPAGMRGHAPLGGHTGRHARPPRAWVAGGCPGTHARPRGPGWQVRTPAGGRGALVPGGHPLLVGVGALVPGRQPCSGEGHRAVGRGAHPTPGGRGLAGYAARGGLCT